MQGETNKLLYYYTKRKKKAISKKKHIKSDKLICIPHGALSLRPAAGSSPCFRERADATVLRFGQTFGDFAGIFVLHRVLVSVAHPPTLERVPNGLLFTKYFGAVKTQTNAA